MTETILIDFMELKEAAPKVNDLHRALSDASRQLGHLDVGVEMEPALASRIRAAVDAAASDTSRAATSIRGLDNAMVACARLAEQAHDIGVVKTAAQPGLYKLKMIDGFLSGAADRTWKEAEAMRNSELTRLGKATERLNMLNRAASLVPSTFADFRNPHLSDRQRAGRFGARAGSMSAGARVADMAGGAVRGKLDDLVEKKMAGKGMATAIARMAGSRAPFLLGGGVGLAVGIGWTALDLKFGISAKAGELAADGMQEFHDHVLDPAGDAIADGVGKIADGAGKVADGVGKLTDGLGSIL
ncbi:hypothetical protein [Actinomadura livida]|uniref:X-X-X-Leu-X-X-Gly heptad repeat protein n=1 Tax=Actinomadura livida TaxID=79909 RepID=A0A7W7I7B4_9ACTN|nr:MULTISPECIES: hypothetical protein [Actinomadura]MBB4771804.1 X-X-X-Leu-X-X-Gly heptad repeat protein [Actinomadura catellatispora]GGU02590.1 hypothetical protein GCM10010208_28260 [Actinomadura livida]